MPYVCWQLVNSDHLLWLSLKKILDAGMFNTIPKDLGVPDSSRLLQTAV